MKWLIIGIVLLLGSYVVCPAITELPGSFEYPVSAYTPSIGDFIDYFAPNNVHQMLKSRGIIRQVGKMNGWIEVEARFGATVWIQTYQIVDVYKEVRR